MGFNSKYKSGKSVGKNQTVPIAVDDPRLKPGKRGQTYARQGAEIQEIGLDGKSLITGGKNINNPSGTQNIATGTSEPASVVLPPIGNKPPKTYPGGSGPVIIVPTDPTNVSATWSGNDLVITFDWDYSNALNDTVTQFIVELTSGGVTKRTQSNIFVPNTTQTLQTITVTKSIITSMFNVFRTSFSSICVLTGDPLNNISSTICAATVPTYTLSLPVPVITVSDIASGYSVAYTSPTDDIYDAIDIVEYESTSATEPTGVTYTRTYLGTINPANVISSGTNKRWVKARFSSDAGIYTAFSAAQAVTPTSPVVADNDGPPNVTTVTTSGGIDTSGYLGFNAYADISWSAVTTGDIRGYRIRFSNDGGTTYSYADSPGTGTTYRLGGLAVGSTYKIAVATYDQYNNTSTSYISGTDVTVAGIPSVSNYITAGPFEFGVGVGSVATNKGLYFDASNYWYINATNSARLKVGGSTSNYLYWDGSDFLIDGNISARKGTFSGNVTVAPGGSLQSFITPPTVFSISSVTYTASTATYTTTANHGYIVGDDILISGLLPEGYNGKFTITARTLTTFTVTNATNAVVTDAVGSVIIITGAGFVLNKDGLTFNSSITRDITTINSETGLFTTKSANIGGWAVDSNKIFKTSAGGQGNLSLDSLNGYIYVSSDSISTYTAGINSASSSTSVAFWAGSAVSSGLPNPSKQTDGVYDNKFVVRMDGKVFASGAEIRGGTVSSIGALGSVVIDGEKSLISLATDSKTSYLVPRNGNIYLIAPSSSTTPLWGSLDGAGAVNTVAPNAEPYFVAGSNFKDPWNNTTQGIGMYTGSWDYFTNGVSDPFVTVSKSGTIQLSASPDIGMIVEKGGATGDAFTVPTIMMYTSKAGTAPYKPSTAYGSWATFQKGHINLSASASAFISIFGDSTNGGTSAWPSWTNTSPNTYASVSNSIFIRSGNTTNTTSDKSAYAGASQIVINGSKVSITGIPRASTFDMDDYRIGTLGAGNYRNLPSLGYPPRQRIVIEDPETGEAQLGFAVYYLDTEKINGTGPGVNMGAQGDIAVVF